MAANETLSTILLVKLGLDCWLSVFGSLAHSTG